MRRSPRLISLCVSLATMALDLGLFALCVAVLGSASATLIAARWICGVLGAAGNFALNRRLAFTASTRSVAVQLPRYATVAGGAVTLATAVWWALQRATPFDPRVLHPLSAGAVWLTFTYPLLRRWVFR